MSLLNDIHRYGLDMRFALDIASIKMEIRPRGLLHIHSSQASSIHLLLKKYNLKVVAERYLEGSRDPYSREGILSDLKPNTPNDRLWHEIWFSKQDTATIDPLLLFRSPGKYLSYPACCVNAMMGTKTLSTFYELYINEPQQRHWEINRLTTIFTAGLLTPDFFPCSLSCRLARDFARPFIEIARDILGQERASDWIKRAKQPYFVYKDFLYTAFDYEYENNHLIATMESMSKKQLQEIGKTISCHTSNFSIIPFAHFYEHRKDLLRISLIKNGRPFIEFTASHEASGEDAG